MGKKLLIADDSVTIQKVIKLALSSEGYDILAVSEGKEAVRAIEQENPAVVLIDLALPVLNAYEVKEAINEKFGHVRFILLASAFEKVDETRASAVGFHSRLVKPFDPSLLRKTVAEQMVEVPDAVQNEEPQQQDEIAVETPASPPSFNFEKLKTGLSQQISFDKPSESPGEFVEDHSAIELAGSSNDHDESGSLQPVPPLDDLPPVQDMHPTLAESDEQTMTSTSEINASEPSRGETDIRGLTESTIKLSGLDEYQWNLDDSKYKKSVSEPDVTKPMEFRNKAAQLKQAIEHSDKSMDDGGSNFLELGLKLGQNPVNPKTVQDVPSTSFLKQAPGQSPDLSESDSVGGSQWIETPDQLNARFNPQSTESQETSEVKLDVGYKPEPVSRAEIEEMIRKDTNAILEKVVRESLPAIAEKVIRQEIEKILQEK